MLNVLIIMIAGISIGYLFRHLDFLQKTEKSISYTVFALLFILGISVGSNPMIVQNLGQFGGQAILIATASMFGSSLAAWIVFNLFFKKGDKK